jgi:hypothetical protein
MKTKPRASKPARKATKRAPAKRPATKKKPASKAVARPRATGARSKKAPARKKAVVVARGPRRAAGKKAPARKSATRSATKTAAKRTVAKRGAAKKAPPKTVARKSANGRRANGRVPVVREFTKREAWSLFDGEARKRTGMTGKEFIEWWHRGEFEKDPDDMPGVMSVAMLLPLVEAD